MTPVSVSINYDIQVLRSHGIISQIMYATSRAVSITVTLNPKTVRMGRERQRALRPDTVLRNVLRFWPTGTNSTTKAKAAKPTMEL